MPWYQGHPERAIHDTVAAIVRDPAFARDLSESLLGRLLQLLGRIVDRLGQWVDGIPYARWIAIGCATLIAATLVARVVLGRRMRDADAVGRPRKAGGSSTDPWIDAERLAAAGDFEGAAHALYHAVLGRIAAADGLRLHPSLTGGDYVRELRRRGSPRAQAFRGFVRRFDHFAFGSGPTDATGYAALVEEAGRVTATARAA